MAQKAKSRGIDGIVILDHQYHATEQDVEACREVSGVTVFRGMELSIKNDQREKEDIIIVSSHTPAFDYSKGLHVSKLDKLKEYVDRTMALTILAHPYRRRDHLVFDPGKEFRPDCVEIASTHIKKQNRPKIYQLAKQHGMHMVSVSDAHKTKHIGEYCIDLMNDVKTEDELIGAVRSYEYILLEKRLAPVDFGGKLI